ncbi:MAG: hypothetical protein HKP61_10745 [Dactylosporangium sp.]|nr:hypothetical protein [Dactylosporangium sp.]NNJ61407.1 hypothetical protein [Dactylosporangium sp.]
MALGEAAGRGLLAAADNELNGLFAGAGVDVSTIDRVIHNDLAAIEPAWAG